MVMLVFIWARSCPIEPLCGIIYLPIHLPESSMKCSPRHPVIFSALMIGVSNHLLSIVFRFHYHSQKVIGSLE